MNAPRPAIEEIRERAQDAAEKALERNERREQAGKAKGRAAIIIPLEQLFGLIDYIEELEEEIAKML